MKYNLVGIDGNAYSVMGYVQRAMRECEFSKEERDAYLKDAMSSDYNHLLCVSVEAIDKCNKVAEEGGYIEMDDDTIEEEDDEEVYD